MMAPAARLNADRLLGLLFMFFLSVVQTISAFRNYINIVFL